MHDILLVEDNLGNALLIQEAFSEIDIETRFAVVHDGEEALEYLRKKGGFQDTPTVDLVILDINLPKKDGIEVFDEIKSDDNLKHHTIMMLTSSSYEQDILKEKGLSPYFYVIKPSSLASFHLITDPVIKLFKHKNSIR